MDSLTEYLTPYVMKNVSIYFFFVIGLISSWTAGECFGFAQRPINHFTDANVRTKVRQLYDAGSFMVHASIGFIASFALIFYSEPTANFMTWFLFTIITFDIVFVLIITVIMFSTISVTENLVNAAIEIRFKELDSKF